jgi:EAL domain-containing protein (putative c-di-GMP-specific phosphodiesterase class I)
MTAAIRAYIDAIARDPLREDLRVTDSGRVIGRFMRAEIDSAFQSIAPIDTDATTGASAASLSGVQALARVHAQGGGELSPWNPFEQAASGDELVLLDRRCRIVHTLNFFAQDALAEVESIDLLLNVHRRLLSVVTTDHGRAFGRALDSLAVAARRIVIVLPPVEPATLDLQCQVLASYRLNGFRVAAGADRADLAQKVLARQPADVLRVDARVLLRDAQWPAAFRAAHEVGAQVHVTRVETEAERRLAQDLGATHWQGWHLAPALPSIQTLAAVA